MNPYETDEIKVEKITPLLQALRELHLKDLAEGVSADNSSKQRNKRKKKKKKNKRSSITEALSSVSVNEQRPRLILIKKDGSYTQI